jgi:hypothetical protein
MPKDNGIYATYCDEWGVFGNIVDDNCHSGIRFDDSQYVLIENNFVNWSVGYGVGLIRTTESIVTGNRLIGHLSHPIRAELAHSCNFTNNIIEGGNSSIHVWHSNGVFIFNNTIWGALYFGIWMDHTDNSLLYHNDVGWNGLANVIEDQCVGNQWDDGVSVGNWWHNWEVGSGQYNISDLSSIQQNQDNYPNRSIQIISVSSPIAYEISSTGHTMEFMAKALNPLAYEVYANGTLVDSGDWNGGLIIANVDGLLAGHNVLEFRAIHLSGNYESAYSSATIEDLTPPEWVTAPQNEILYHGESLSQQLEAYDTSGIGDWYINDTVNFYISESGLLLNNLALDVGEYGLHVYVEDIFGNVQDMEIHISVIPLTTTGVTSTTSTSITVSITTSPSISSTTSTTSTTLPSDGDYTIIIIIVGAGGVLVIIIIVIMAKRR